MRILAYAFFGLIFSAASLAGETTFSGLAQTSWDGTQVQPQTSSISIKWGPEHVAKPCFIPADATPWSIQFDSRGMTASAAFLGFQRGNQIYVFSNHAGGAVDCGVAAKLAGRVNGPETHFQAVQNRTDGWYEFALKFDTDRSGFVGATDWQTYHPLRPGFHAWGKLPKIQ